MTLLRFSHGMKTCWLSGLCDMSWLGSALGPRGCGTSPPWMVPFAGSPGERLRAQGGPQDRVLLTGHWKRGFPGCSCSMVGGSQRLGQGLQPLTRATFPGLCSVTSPPLLGWAAGLGPRVPRASSPAGPHPVRSPRQAGQFLLPGSPQRLEAAH